MRKVYLKMIVVGFCAIALLPAPSASASPAKDIEAVARVLTFLENGPSGRTAVGIVFDPDKPGSVAEKDAVMTALGNGYTAGGVTVFGRPMQAGAIGGVKVVFLTRGVNYAAVGSDAKAQHITAIGSGSACVMSGACVMGISTDPVVQIVVNHSTAAAVGAVFKAAFRMMIHEV